MKKLITYVVAFSFIITCSLQGCRRKKILPPMFEPKTQEEKTQIDNPEDPLEALINSDTSELISVALIVVGSLALLSVTARVCPICYPCVSCGIVYSLNRFFRWE